MSAGAAAPGDVAGATARAVVLPFALAYFLSYVYRSINAVISPELIGEFSLGAAELGLLTSAYFLAFAAFQLPLGLLLDRFGPRRVNATLFAVASAGALLFSLSRDFGTLLAGRALIGLGVCAGLMSSIKVFTLWFPMDRLPALTGRMLFVGGLGAMAATVPVEMAVQASGWRDVFRVIAVVTAVAALALFRVVPERQAEKQAQSWTDQLQGVAVVFRSGVFWRIAAPSALFQSINMALQGLWAGPWLLDVAGLDRNAVAAYLLALAAATMVGFLGWGTAAYRLARRGVAPFTLFKVGTALFILVQVPFTLGATTGAVVLWVCFGLFGTASSLSFTILSHAFPVAMTGRANTALNLLVFASAFLFQWLFGAVVGLWPSEAGHYHPDGYRAAFAALLGLECLAFAWLLAGSRSRKLAVSWVPQPNQEQDRGGTP